MQSSQSRKVPRIVFYIRTSILLLILTGLFLFFMNVSSKPVLVNSSKYLDTSLRAEERIADLLAQMTMAEKIGQMALVEKDSLKSTSDIATYGLGGLLSGAGAKPATNTAESWRNMIVSYQAEAGKSRLALPLLYGVDAVHGHALVPGATVFPHQIGLGATGDSDLVEKIGAATAQDLIATGVNWNYAPNLDLPTDTRWGRMYETFSDDPLLTGRLGAAYVRGLQSGQTGGNISTLATLKHFAGVGSMQWNSSLNKNFKIDQGVTKADIERLHTEYLPPFKAAIDAGALSVMVGLHMWGDKKFITRESIIQGELKENLGFTGFVVSDWYGVYENAPNKFIATVKAINAGVDMVMLPFDYETFVTQMTRANMLGLISDKRIDDAVTRILRAKFALGLFDGVANNDTLELGDNQALARTAVAQSLVLLKNENDVLPITNTVQHIRVAGSAADNVGLQSGAWTVEWQGVDGNWLPNSTSILAGIKEQAGASTLIEYDIAGEFVTSKQADVGIAVVGETPYAEGWGDREYPILSNKDLMAIKKLQATCAKVIVVTVSGRPLLIANEIDSWDALVAAWLPGTQGGGVADVLFGKRQFMGTLPVSWPKTSEQLPITSGGVTADGTQLLFPRYFGLSY